MDQELDYAEMLEIPVSTVNVVKKKSFFKRRQKPTEQPDELKDMVVESVNERVGAYVYSEDVSDPPKPENVKKSAGAKEKGGRVLLFEAAAIGLIAIAIFVTNIFMPNSAINTFITDLTGTGETTQSEPAYNEFTLSPVVSDLSNAEVAMSESGAIFFTAQGCVYPVCGGKVAKVYEDGGLYTVEVAHTSSFTSVVTGLTNVYYEIGTEVASNVPLGYSDGNSEVRVTLYDGGNLLNGYTLMDEVPVWKS